MQSSLHWQGLLVSRPKQNILHEKAQVGVATYSEDSHLNRILNEVTCPLRICLHKMSRRRRRRDRPPRSRRSSHRTPRKPRCTRTSLRGGPTVLRGQRRIRADSFWRFVVILTLAAPSLAGIAALAVDAGKGHEGHEEEERRLRHFPAGYGDD